MSNKAEFAKAVTEAKEAFMLAAQALHDAVQALVDHETTIPAEPPADANLDKIPAAATPETAPAADEVPAEAETTPATETAGEQNG